MRIRVKTIYTNTYIFVYLLEIVQIRTGYINYATNFFNSLIIPRQSNTPRVPFLSNVRRKFANPLDKRLHVIVDVPESALTIREIIKANPLALDSSVRTTGSSKSRRRNDVQLVGSGVDRSRKTSS